jgi:large repetitive protein
VFTPAATFTGTAQISYTITDVDGATASSTHNVLVGPSAVDDTRSTQMNTPVSGNMAAGDTYLPLSAFSVVTGPTHGTINFLSEGTYTYTPAPGFFGTDTFTYRVTDPNGQVATATDTITVNAPPALTDPSPVVGTPFINPTDPANLIVPAVDNVLVTLPLGAYFTDANGDPLTITPNLTGLPTWLTYDPTTRTLTGTPPADNLGPVTVPVTVDDGHGGTFVATVTIQPTNPGPVANFDSVSTPINTPVTVDLLANDTDADRDRLTVTAATVPAAQGSVALVGSNWVFTPVAGFTGTATISYSITDIDGATATSTHDVQVGGAAVNDAYTTQINVPVQGNAAANDTTSPGSTFTVVTGPTHGIVNMQSDGTYTYTPAPGYTGVDTFVYRVTDLNGQTATATDTITINAPPALTDPSPVVGTPFIDPANAANLIVPAVDNVAVSLPLAQYYADPNGNPMTLTPNLAALPAWLSYNPTTQTFTGTPPRDNTGADVVIPVTVTDNNGGTFISSVTIRATNPGPTANTDSVTTSVNTAVTVNLLANDTDVDNDALTVTTATVPAAQGTVALVNGNWVFTPTAGFTGVATINYTIRDIDGATSSSTHDVNVVPLAAADDRFTTTYRTPVDGNAANGDTFPVGSTFSTSTTPAHGTVVFRADGTYTYTPAAGFAGTDTFRYVVTDPRGQQVMATETIIVTPPTLTATDDSYTTPFRTAVQGNAATGDVFATGSTFASTSQPASGTVVMAANGTYTYTPPANFAGTVTFNYRITDPTGATVTAIETIVVSPPQLIAVNDAYTTGYGQALNGNAAVGDTFATGSRFTTASAPGHGTVVMNPNGTFRYVPQVGFTGVDTFTYTVTDPTGRTVTATETVTITPRAPLHRCLTTFGRIPGFTPRRR